MRDLSISRAWEEARALMTRDGRLIASLALAVIALPVAISGLVNPRGVSDASTPMWVDLVVLACSLVVLAGQLALIRLALAPSITVGEAIAHGFRRMPIYLVVAVLIAVALLAAAMPLLALLVAARVPLDQASLIASPTFLLLFFVYLALLCFVGVRMLMSSPAASAEPIGPLAILKRSWQLTAGHWWVLFGFLVIFFIGAAVLVYGVTSAIGAVVALGLGPIAPFSTSALVVALVEAAVQSVVTVLLAVMLARIYVQLSGGDARASVPTTGT